MRTADLQKKKGSKERVGSKEPTVKARKVMQRCLQEPGAEACLYAFRWGDRGRWPYLLQELFRGDPIGASAWCRPSASTGGGCPKVFSGAPELNINAFEPFENQKPNL